MFLSLLTNFLLDKRTLGLLALIVADLITGIMAALRTNTFRWKEVGRFYQSNVIPFVLGYLLIYVIALAGIADLFGDLWGELTATVGVGPAVLSLGASIAGNLAQFRNPPVSTPPPENGIYASLNQNIKRE